MLDPFGILVRRLRGDDVGDVDLDRAAVADVNALHVAVEIPSCYLKGLDVTVVHVHPDGVAVAAMHLGVDINYRLHVVVASR